MVTAMTRIVYVLTILHVRFHCAWWFICTDNKQSEHLGGPGHASDGDFLPGGILLKTVDFERPGGREWLPSGTPFQRFYTFFGRVFGRARVQISNVPLLRSVFCLQRKKSAFKRSHRVRGMGPPPGTRFCMYSYHTKQNKKAKTKKNTSFV